MSLLIGAPIGLEDTVSTGVVSGMRLREGTKVIQTTAPASHGSSGGPLLNRNGDVIGLMTFLVEGGENLNFAVPINYLRGALGSVSGPAANRLAPLHEPSTSTASGVFVYFYRTPGHIQYSSDSVFQSVADELMLFLKSENVPTINDRVGRVFASSGASYSTYELISASEKAGASGLLYITVDRPYSAWLKVTAKFYDIDGRVLWQEEAEKKSGITSAGSIEKVCHSIETKMLSHLATLVESHSPSETPRPPNVTVTDNPR